MKQKVFLGIAFIVLLAGAFSSVEAASLSAASDYKVLTVCACGTTTDVITLQNTGPYLTRFYISSSGSAERFAHLNSYEALLLPGETAYVVDEISIPCSLSGTWGLTTTFSSGDLKTSFTQDIIIKDCGLGTNTNPFSNETRSSSQPASLPRGIILLLVINPIIGIILILILLLVAAVRPRPSKERSAPRGEEGKEEDDQKEKKLFSPGIGTFLVILVLVVIAFLFVYASVRWYNAHDGKQEGMNASLNASSSGTDLSPGPEPSSTNTLVNNSERTGPMNASQSPKILLNLSALFSWNQQKENKTAAEPAVAANESVNATGEAQETAARGKHTLLWILGGIVAGVLILIGLLWLIVSVSIRLSEKNQAKNKRGTKR
ncbi:hypothetical protein COY95_04990 [Candidatus Woesearchaeota archaeon CG_4_10_14_0_8_um_filter_47_5]|nr:MAG: hypothetical protein COY95_04990 [Candidatus Woesearchaeota archaeon CG_4_10_14_0_8_um_filter_47_5]